MNHPNPARWWKHRRRMAYVAVIWTILQTFLWVVIELISPGAVSSLSTVVGWSYGSVSTIILGYFGNTAVETYRHNGNSNYSYQEREEDTLNDKPWENDGI